MSAYPTSPSQFGIYPGRRKPTIYAGSAPYVGGADTGDAAPYSTMAPQMSSRRTLGVGAPFPPVQMQSPGPTVPSAPGAAPAPMMAPRLQDTFGLRQNMYKTMPSAAVGDPTAQLKMEHMQSAMPPGPYNYFQNRQNVADANTRANEQGAANVGLSQSAADYNSAAAGAMGITAPAQAGLYGAQANLANAQAPYIGTVMQSQAGLNQAQGQAAVAGAGASNQELTRLTGEHKAALQRIAQLEAQLQKAQGTAQQPQRQIGLTQPEIEAAQDPNVGYGGVVAMRHGKAPGDPSTRPSAQLQGVQQQAAPASQPSAADSIPVHVNPQTGERIKWDGRQWVKIS